MYRVYCDGNPLLGLSVKDAVLVNPKIKLEVNTVGEGSFTIYKNHPYYSKLKKLKSVFTVYDDYGVIFRGRATGDTVDFNHGMHVDLEGAMAYFNDSIVRPFNFPDDFLEDADYIAAAEGGNVIAFFLGWLINNHNSQVQYYQKLQLGNVTVTDPNNYITRSSSEYASTWDVLKAKLFDSSLGGYLCIRYENGGNYIDYLSEFTETNSQEIVFGENLLDLKGETEASATYSAIIPIGTLGLTIEGLEDKNVTDDIVKVGDTLYSKSAVKAYGWIYAPTSETTWDDVTDDSNLLTKGVKWLADCGAFMNAMEATAVDLHFADKEVESLRIYKNVNVRSSPHDVEESFPLAKLEIDLLNPQNTKITVGKTLMPLTERTTMLQEETKKQYSKLSKTDEEIKLEVQNTLKDISSTIVQQLEQITLSVENGETSSTISLMLGETLISSEEITMSGVVTFQGLESGTTTIDGSWIETGTITADQIAADSITLGKLDEELLNTVNDAYSMAEDAEYLAGEAADVVSGWCYKSTTYIDGSKIMTGTVQASELLGGTVGLLDEDEYMVGELTLTDASSSGYAVDLTSYAALRLVAEDGNLYLGNKSYGTTNYLALDGEDVFIRAGSFYPTGEGADLGNSSYAWNAVYSYTDTIQHSDRNVKNSIEELPEKYLEMLGSIVPVRFKLNNGTSGRFHVGFIAQEVEEAMAAAGIDSQEFGGFVKDKDADGNDVYMLRYGEFIGILAAKIKQIDTILKEKLP